ncbi:MAG: CbbQ/NirQ/NorQ/GpvN family protein [Bdellovibrionales bacterium]|nr:CbbQ/NirQ/NorQ/GpvN family protein [Bdellovibrionales bacterium]
MKWNNDNEVVTDLFYLVNKNEEEIFNSCYENQLPLLLKGPTGCGKSQFVEFMSYKLGKPLVKIACNEDTNATDLLGRFIIKGGDTIWQDGPVIRAIRSDAILYFDEIAEAREDVIVAIHPLTDHRREIYLDKINEVVKASNNFMVVASFNPGYQSGLKEMKPSTRQRFVTLSMDYIDEKREAELIQNISGVEFSKAQALSRLANRIRRSENFDLKATVSTRILIHAGCLIKSGINVREAAHVAIAETLTDERQVVSALIDIIDISL